MWLGKKIWNDYNNQHRECCTKEQVSHHNVECGCVVFPLEEHVKDLSPLVPPSSQALSVGMVMILVKTVVMVCFDPGTSFVLMTLVYPLKVKQTRVHILMVSLSCFPPFTFLCLISKSPSLILTRHDLDAICHCFSVKNKTTICIYFSFFLQNLELEAVGRWK